MLKMMSLRKSGQKASRGLSRMVQRESKLAAWATPLHPLLRLQQTVGNQGVGRLLQAKLKIAQPEDRYQQEADRVAEQIMRMPAPRLQRACVPCAAGGPPCPKGRKEKEDRLHRKIGQGSDSERASVPDNFLQHLGPGQPLDTATRAFFEAGFGHDFSHVRIHTDVRAVESARAVNALAYPVGRDIVFGPRRYAPETTAGKRLLAHELTGRGLGVTSPRIAGHHE